MKNKKVVNLEWYNMIQKLRKEGENLEGKEKLEIIPEEERELFCLSRFDQELMYDWDKIENIICNENLNTKYQNSLKNKLPKGIKEFYEVDENGNPTGKYDWDYIINVLECFANLNESELNVFEMWDSEYADEIQEILDLMPYDVGYLLENINNSGELYEMFATSQFRRTTLDLPMQLRNNATEMYSLFEECNWDDIDSCWELLSDNLKQDKKFLERLFELDAVKESPATLLKINPEIYKDDDDFKMKMLECDCCYLFQELWEDSKDLWDSVMEKIDNDEFFRSCGYFDLDDIQIHNSELAYKLYDEIDKRISRAIQNGEKIEFSRDMDIEGKIPLEYLRIMLINRDRKNLGLDVQKIVIGANGEKLKLPEEISAYNTEIENENEDLTIIYGTDKEGRQNILYYYPSSVNIGFIRQQRVLNKKGDVTNMYEIGAYYDGRIMDIIDANVSYTYNEKGEKTHSLSDDWVMGTLYNEYDENGQIAKTTEIPCHLSEQDCNIIAVMKRAVGKTIGNTYNAQAEINKFINNEKELEGGEQDDD